MNDEEFGSASRVKRGESYLELREAFLDEEGWKTVQLMGIVDRLYCERLVLVRRIVYYEGAWAARTGRATRAREGKGPSQLGGSSHFVGTTTDKAEARGNTPGKAAAAASRLGQT